MIKLTKTTLLFMFPIVFLQASNEYYGDDELSKNSDCSSTYHDDFNDDDTNPYDLSALNQAAATVEANMTLKKYEKKPWEPIIKSAEFNRKKALKEVKAFFENSEVKAFFKDSIPTTGKYNSTPVHIAAQTPHADAILRYLLKLNPKQAITRDCRGLTPDAYTNNKAKCEYLHWAKMQHSHNNDNAFIANDDYSCIKDLVASLNKNKKRKLN